MPACSQCIAPVERLPITIQCDMIVSHHSFLLPTSPPCCLSLIMSISPVCRSVIYRIITTCIIDGGAKLYCVCARQSSQFLTSYTVVITSNIVDETLNTNKQKCETVIYILQMTSTTLADFQRSCVTWML